MAKARGDGTVKSLERKIEKEKGLPSGTVKIVNKNGTDARGDKKVGTLRKEK